MLTSWAEKHGGAVEEYEDHLGGEMIRITFEPHSMVMAPGIIETDASGYFDPFGVDARDALDVTVEEWNEPGEEDYQKEENVESTGTVGGDPNPNVWDDAFSILETAPDGWRRKITIKVKD